VQVLLPAAAHWNPADRPGLASFTADLLEEGTESMSSAEIANAVESLGGVLSSGAGWASAAVSLTMLSRDAAKGLALLTEVATRPAFENDEIERLRRERFADLSRRVDQPAALAVAVLAHELYGARPYGRTLIGTRASIERLQSEDIRHFFETHRSPESTYVIAVGAFDPNELGAAFDEALGPTVDHPETETPDFGWKPPTQPKVIIVDRPQAAQTELRMGHVSVARNHPDRTVLTVLNSLLGGKFTSRINLNLRERHGYTYGVSTSFAHRRGPGPFVISTAVGTEVTGKAVREILNELERIRDEPASAAEIEETRSYLQGVFPYGLQSDSAVLQHLKTLALFDLPDDYFDLYQEQISAVGAVDLQRAAREQLRPHHIVTVAVGPASELEPQLAAEGDVEVVNSDSVFA
jgi:zinc protease